MDTFIGKIFTDEPSELTDLASANPSIDIATAPLTIDVVPNFQSNPNLFITGAIAEHSYFEIQFHLGNNFWGVPMNFGNDPAHAFCVANNSSSSCAGLNIRQGIAHLIDRNRFAVQDPAIIGGSAIDSPIQKSNGGLPSTNPCSWDILTHGNQAGSNCVQGGPGGTAWHVAPVTHAGPGGAVFLADTHDPDFCVAADHFVLAGLASGHNAQSSTTGCILTGLNPAVGTHVVNFFIRNDNPPRLDIGTGLAQAICALFGNGYATACPQLTAGPPPPNQTFPGFFTSSTTVKPDWWIYTAAYLFTFPFDKSLYFTYSSHFVSGIPSIISPAGPCASDAAPSISAANYMYICNPGYDALAQTMEFAPCLSDPSNICPGTSKPTAIAAGLQVEDYFGNETFTIPLFSQTDPYGARSNLQNLVNNEGSGLAAGGFQFLDTWSTTPTNAGATTQGFSESTISVNPYVSSTPQDSYIVGSIYDRLGTINPLASSQYLDWMSVNSGSPLPNSQLLYPPPPGTVSTIRFTLRGDMYFQDGTPVTAFDVAYSYLSLRATGSSIGALAQPMTGVTVVAKNQIDINLAGFGPFTKLSLSSLPILPGHYWSNAGGSAWDTARTTCTTMSGTACYPVQYTLGPRTFPTGCGNTGQPGCIPTVQASLAGASSFPAANMNPDPTKIVSTFDPIAAGVLIGSGPWECNNTAGNSLGTGCAPGNKQNPGVSQSYVLQRFGKGFATNSPPFDVWFRSNGNLALWLWTLNTGSFTMDFVNFTTMAACFNLPVTTSAPCAHFQTGIGSTNGTAGPASPVTINQVLAVNRFVGINWVSPFDWHSITASPVGIVPLNPRLHEGANGLLVPCSVDAVHGYDC